MAFTVAPATIRRALLLASVASVASVAATPLGAQARAALVGMVRDSAGAPIPLAQVSVLEVRTLTDSAGRFAIDGLRPGAATLAVRRLGFAPLEAALMLGVNRLDSLEVVLVALAASLPALATDAEAAERAYLASFYRRREMGNGFFFNRRELDSTHVMRISDVMRRLPGVRLVPDRSGRQQLRMSRSAGCPPDFWIDGQRAPFLNVDDLPLRDVQALEIYRGASGVPPEFNNRLGNPACGVIVIWTRLPG
jgi:hypothetical protein